MYHEHHALRIIAQPCEQNVIDSFRQHDRETCMDAQGSYVGYGRELLCQYALDELHLVAVVSGDANPMAMLEDREGVGHIVRRNTKVGKAGGKVTQVLRDCIVITSFVQTSDGKAQPVKTEMCVAKDKQAAPVLDLLQGKLRE